MQNTFETTRQRIQSVRNLLAPFELDLASLDKRLADMKVGLHGVESKLSEASSRIDEQRLKIAYSQARVELIEMALKILPRP